MSTPKNGSALERLRGLAREAARFGAVGGVGVLVNLGVFNLLRATTDLQVVRASVIAIVVAIGTNYIGFRFFTYRDRSGGDGSRPPTRELPLFALFSAIGLVIESGVLYAGTYGLGWDGRLATNVFKFAGIGVATVFRFWSYRTWVFKALPGRPPTAGSVVEQRERHAQEPDAGPTAGVPALPVPPVAPLAHEPAAQ
ncbi:GtrA family protein [Streptomyces sp. NPDC102278]|uniref:GtrA family protein n=1 Tax=Streptomyces sp. NPDC102278 TaxID=3366152 RepID=UPI0038085435